MSSPSILPPSPTFSDKSETVGEGREGRESLESLEVGKNRRKFEEVLGQNMKIFEKVRQVWKSIEHIGKDWLSNQNCH